jgi:hypothetical protein
LALAAPATIAYEPNLRRYQDGDRWTYTLQTEQMPLHTMVVDLKFLKAHDKMRFFEARQTDPTGGNKPAPDSKHFVLVGQEDATGDARLFGFSRVKGKFDVSAVSPRRTTLIFPGKWDEQPKPASSVGFLTQRGFEETYKYMRRETVDTGFATIECAVFEAKFSETERMKFWFNPRVGNMVKSEVKIANPKQTMVAFLRETNVLGSRAP